MKNTLAENALSNFEFYVSNALTQIDKGYETEKFYFTLVSGYRALAIFELLLNGDQQEFVNKACKSGYAWLHFLKVVRPRINVKPVYLCTSKNIAFSTALSVGNMPLAKELAKLSAASVNPNFEYEEDFLFFRFMQRIINDDIENNELEDMILRWETVLEGDNSPTLLVCKCLANRDQEEFPGQFDSFLLARQQRLQAYKESVDCDKERFAAEGKVFMEGLCLLRIAELRSIPTHGNYPLIPHLALRLNNIGFPAEDSWRAP